MSTTNFQFQQLVRLKGLGNASYNGKMGHVLVSHSSEIYCNGRYRVQLIGAIASTLQRELHVKPENMEHVCIRCHQSGEKLMFCGRCKHAKYCDRECQRIDWERHKKECSEFCKEFRTATKSPLYLAILRKDLGCVRTIVQGGTDVNMPINTDHETALHAASSLKDNAPIVQYLLEHGATAVMDKARKDGATPLYLAAHEGHLAGVQLLLKHGVDKDKATNNGRSPLWAAAQQGHSDVVQYLVQQGCDKDKANNDCVSPLSIAAHQGHLAVVKYLLEQGADKEKAANDGANPLRVAVAKGHLAVVKYLLEHGADKDEADDDGVSPVYIAAAQGHLAVVKCLLEHGADKDKANNNGSSPLWAAAALGHLAVVHCLVEQGADKDKAANDGMTPLHAAAYLGHAEILSYLLSLGASLNARDDDDDLPIDVAANARIRELIRKEMERREN